MPAGGLGTAALISGGIAGVGAIGKGIMGLFQNHEANQIDKNNPFPYQPVQQEYRQNVNQAQSMAQRGLPEQDYNNQQNNISRNQAGGIMALSNSANPGANLTSLVRAGNDATNNLNAQDAVARNQNMLNLIQQRAILAQQKDKAWDWNSRQKYLGLLAKSQALRGAGDQNVYGALNDVSSIGSTMLKNNMGNNLSFGQLNNQPPLSPAASTGLNMGMINNADYQI